MSIDMKAEAGSFCGMPERKFRLRWEIWQDGVRVSYQSWSPLAQKKFSRERLMFRDNANLIIRMQSLDGGTIEQAMFKCLLGDVSSIEYHHLISAAHGNVFAGMRVKTFHRGIWNCCTDGTVFRENQ